MDSGNRMASHLAWCGLISLHLARKEGMVNSPAQENLFLIRWLANAEKKRLFRKELAIDIRWLLKEGRGKGLRADLPGKLEYLWKAGSGDLLEQNDLYRLQHACNAVQLGGWMYSVLLENEWEGRNKVILKSAASCLYLNKLSMDVAFDNSGKQQSHVLARINGDLEAFDVLLSRSGWFRMRSEDDPLIHLLSATPF